MADSQTVVGETILINGNLTGDEDLLVLGRVEGSITLSKTLHVQESGIVKANIQVRNAIISGVIVGNITATDAVEITEQGRMVGDIKSPRIIIVEGASYRGHVDMGDMEAARPTGSLPSRSDLKPATNRTAPRPAIGPPTSKPASTFKPNEPARPAPSPTKVEPARAAAATPTQAKAAPPPRAPTPMTPPRPPPVAMAAKKKIIVKKK